MAIILCEKENFAEQDLDKKLGNKAVVFTSDYFAGKDFLKRYANENYEYFYFCDNQLYSLQKSDDVKTVQNKLLANKDYTEAKNFNEFLINVTRIKKLSTWLFYPMIIQLEHTNRCNARCVMCGHANVDKSKCYDVSTTVFEKIEALLPFCKYVGLHGYGEPFLTKNLLDIFKVYKKYNVRLYANTNLSYLPEKYIPYIADMFDELNISIDGFTKLTFEKIRVGISFDDVAKNVKCVIESCPNVILNLHTTLMRQNILEADMAIDFAHEKGIKKVVFSEMIPLDANKNSYDSLVNYPAAASHMLELAIKKAKKFDIQIIYPQKFIGEFDDAEIKAQISEIKRLNDNDSNINKEFVIRDDGLLFNRKLLSPDDIGNSGISCEGICDVFQQQIYVDADGTMAACCVDGFHSTGNIIDIANIEEYWDSEQVKLLSDAFNSGNLPSICKQCNYVFLNNLKHLYVL